MRVPHVLVPVTDETQHHLRRVLRLQPGAELSLTDGRGGYARGVLTEADVEAGEWRHERDAPLVTLCAAVSKGSKLDLVIEKATELGVGAIVPVLCARSERRWDRSAVDSRMRRWRLIARSALEQSRGLWLPAIGAPVPFDLAVEEAPGVIFDPRGATADFASVQSARLAVGPEGGFSPDEIEAARTRGWRVAGLGPRVLRTETAAIAAVVLAVAARGGLTGSAQSAEISGSNGTS